MSDNTHPILVSGGGITGLTLACALRKHGIDVEVVETKPVLSDDGGIGLTLVGNCLRALDSIDLARPLIDVGMPADVLRLVTAQGELLGEQPTTGPWGTGIPGHCGISRTHLHGVLSREARARGARIRTGVEMVASRVVSEGVEVEFSDGTRGTYRLCGAAEGAFSKSRKRLFPGVEPVHAGQGSWRALVRRPAGLNTSEIYIGGRYGVVGICPITPDDAYLYIIEASDEGHREDPARLHLTMRERLAGHYGGLIPSLLDQLDDPAKISYRPLPTFVAPAPWHRDRIVLLGDSAHGNPPVLAQGAAMGIEDAVVLAEELAATPAATAEDVLSRFMTRRFDRVNQVVQASTQLARWQNDPTLKADTAGVMSRISQMLAQPV